MHTAIQGGADMQHAQPARTRGRLRFWSADAERALCGVGTALRRLNRGVSEFSEMIRRWFVASWKTRSSADGSVCLLELDYQRSELEEPGNCCRIIGNRLSYAGREPSVVRPGPQS